MRDEIKRFADLDELSRAVAEDIYNEIKDSIGRKGNFTIALSGGHTPSKLYHILATDYRDLIRWDQVHIFFGDERYVPHTDTQSNFKMTEESLLDLIPIPFKNVHPIATDHPDPEKAAIEYEGELKKMFSGPDSFDVVLLGMGKEGHTASLFPNSPALDEKRRWVLPVNAPVTPSRRITLTYNIFNRSAATFLLVAGEDKCETIGNVILVDADYHTFPIKGIMPTTGRLVWYLDAAAASKIL